uniref:Palmitoyltransferase n=1 Tax=Sphenodon punctatus TaxID=8508 RepID=A0A8D0H6C7_SPHPU
MVASSCKLRPKGEFGHLVSLALEGSFPLAEAEMCAAEEASLPLWGLDYGTGSSSLFCCRNCLFLALNVTVKAAVFGEYTWEVLSYCQELEFSTPFLLLPYLLLPINAGFFLLCSCTDPGTVTKSNQALFAQAYAYDGVMFEKGAICPTCNVRKPARSKHCGLCERCVHRFDHHCVWINNCVGAFNARYFCLYLFTLTVMAATVAVVTAAFLIHVVLVSGMMLGSYIDAQGQERAVEILFLTQHLFLTFPRIIFMLGFVVVLSLVLGAYFCFTLYLALTNQTSNEWYKSRRYKCSLCQTLRPHDRHIVYRNIYSKGACANLKEIFKPLASLEKKKR